MLSDDRFTNRMFLLSLAPLLAACPAGDDTSGDTTTGPSTSGGSSTNATTSSGMEGTSSTSSMATESTAMGSTESGTAADETTAGLDCEGGPRVGEIVPVCLAYATQYNDCSFDGSLPQACIDRYAAYCQYTLDQYTMAYGEVCAMSFVELYACVTALTCEELMMVEMNNPCAAQFEAFATACPVP
jgi:hypothetical protein